MISVSAYCMCVAPEGAGLAPRASAPLKGKKDRGGVHEGKRQRRRRRRSAAPHLDSRSGRLRSTCSQRKDRGNKTRMPPICLLIIHLLSSGCHREPHAKNGLSLLCPVIICFTHSPLFLCVFTHFLHSYCLLLVLSLSFPSSLPLFLYKEPRH